MNQLGVPDASRVHDGNPDKDHSEYEHPVVSTTSIAFISGQPREYVLEVQVQQGFPVDSPFPSTAALFEPVPG